MQRQTQFIFKQGFVYSIGNILIKLSGVILIPLYLRFISEEEYGVVTLFETLFQFIMILSGFGVKGGFMRWYHDMNGEDEKKKLFFTSWSFNLSTSFLTISFAGVFLFFFSYEIFQYQLEVSTILFFLSATFFRLLFDLPFYLLKIEQKAVAQTGWLFLNISLLLITTFYFLEVEKMGVKGIYLAQLISHSITFVFLLPLILRSIIPSFNKPVLKSMLHYGLPLAISNILTTVLTLSDRHIINQYQNLGEVAGYSMGFKVANLIQMVVIASFITGYTNYYFKNLHNEDNQALFQRILRYFIVIVSLGGIFIVLFSPEIIYIVSMGSEFFQASVPIVPVLMLGLMFAGLRQLFTLPLNKHKKTRRISIILVVSAIVNLGGNFLLIPVIGKMGASVSTVLAQLFAVAWFYAEVKKIEPLQFALLPNIVLLLAWSGLVFFGMQFFHLPLLAGWAVKLGLILAFIATLFITGHINKEELGEVKIIYRKITGRRQ